MPSPSWFTWHHVPAPQLTVHGCFPLMLQLPSNIALARFGGPVWISLVCLSWGALGAAFAGVRSHASFFALRFLLGAFQAAGASTVLLYYVSMFYPRNRTQLPMTSLVSDSRV